MSSPSDQSAQNNTVTLSQVIEAQNGLQVEAAEVIPFDITKCSKPLGHIKQSVYSCLTCNPIDPHRPGQHTRAGLCSSCSVSCHTDHQLVELFVRRDFLCDCGTDRCNPGQCRLVLDPHSNSLDPDHPPQAQAGPVPSNSTASIITNKYDKNFDGQFCVCERGQRYDPETETEDMYQCLACEDWRHRGCLGPHPDPDDWDDLICADCVQNDPKIRSIMFKHAGGEGIGMIVCTSSGPDGSEQVTCYGKLPQPDHQLDKKPSSLDSSNLQTSELTHDPIDPIPQSQIPADEQTNDSSAASGETDIKHPPVDLHLSGDVSTDLPTVSRPQESPLATQQEPLRDEHVEQTELVGHSPDVSLAGANKRRPGDDQLLESTFSFFTKRPRCFEEKTESDDDSKATNKGKCCAPFQNLSRSILGSIDPKFSNVYLVSGWRDRWCKCLDCSQLLSQTRWLIEDEEVWEPGEDSDSSKSLHELGLEALKKLPRDQLVNGLFAYNKLKEELSEFLKPFEANDSLVTELDIKRFFLNTKSKIVNQTW